MNAFKKHFYLITGTILLVSSISAQALITNSHFCGKTYRFESFALAQGQAIKGTNEMFIKKPKILDEMCFRMGTRQALETLQSDRQCKDKFNQGQTDGKKFEVKSSSNECYLAGVKYAQAVIITAARSGNESNSSRECVKAYHTGKQDAMNMVVLTQYSWEKMLSYCYESGYGDGELFGDLM
jgi:hypothetical protein